MNKITRKKPNYIKLHIIALQSKYIFDFNSSYPHVMLMLGERNSGKNYYIKELNKKYGKH